jgi:hypothetical protein
MELLIDSLREEVKILKTQLQNGGSDMMNSSMNSSIGSDYSPPVKVPQQPTPKTIGSSIG